MKITDGANGVEFFPTSTAEGGHIALRADTDGSYRYAIDNYNDTVRIVRQADADATGGVVVTSVDGNGDFTVLRDFTAGRTGYFTSNSADSRVLYLDQHAATAGGIVQFRNEADVFTWELVGRNNQFYIYNNGLSRQSIYINPTNNFVGINGNTTPKAFLHVTDGTNSYPTDSNNKLVVESTGHTYIGLGGGDSSDVGIHFGDSTAVNRGRLAYTHSDDSMKISTSGVVRYILDGGGNVGYNSPIKPSTGSWRNFGFGSLRMFGRSDANNPDGGIGTNFYFTTANAELRVSAHAASRIRFDDDQINFDNAGTGLIDSAITWNNRMFINALGYLGVGATTAIAQLHVDAKDTPYDSASGLAIFQDNGDRQIVIGGLGIFRRDTNGNADLRINYLGYNGGVTQPRDLDIYDGKSNRFARFDGSTQNLGIGEDAPERRLVLNGTLGTASLEIKKNTDRIVYLGTGSSAANVDQPVLLLYDAGAIKVNISSVATSYLTGGNLVIGNTSSTYDFEVFGTDAKMFAHYSGSSRGGIAAFSTQRIAMTTTSVNDNLVFGYNSSTAASADFVERMRIDNGTGFVGINANNPLAMLHTKVGTSGGSPYDSNVGVFAEGATRSIIQMSSTSDAYLMFGDAAQNNRAWFGYQHSNDQLLLHTGSTIYMDGKTGLKNTSPSALLTLGTYPTAGTYINQATYPDVPSEHMIHITAPSTTNYYGGGISFGENTFTAANIVAIDAGGGGFWYWKLKWNDRKIKN